MINNKYKVIDIIGSGSFGSIYKGKNKRTEELVAIKIEPIINNTKLLKHETQVYQYLSGLKGVPILKWFGVDDKNYYMIIELLGNSLESVIKIKKTFSLKTIKSIGIIILKILQSIHEKGLIHRDVKPDNFLMGLNENKNDIYIIDFGFCKRYLDDMGNHIAIKKTSDIIGSPNYISINIHNLCEPSRRDDLESLAYILIYFYYGELEWMNNYYEKIKIMKEKIIYKKNMPIFLINYLNKIRNLKYDETPDYNNLINIFMEE